MNEAAAAYEAPAITDLGTVLEITESTGTSEITDADFPAGTNLGDFTFSP